MMKLMKTNAENTSLQHLSRNICTRVILLNVVTDPTTHSPPPPPIPPLMYLMANKITKLRVSDQELTSVSIKQQQI